MEQVKAILRMPHHRSRQRIRDLGEVFTPEKYVQKMLDMLQDSVWADTGTVFFEPTCGHGNFVSAIVQRRLNAFLKKAKQQKIKKPHFYAVANTLNNLWAIDIDSQNIKLCRYRIRSLVFNFLLKYEKSHFLSQVFIKKNKDFLTHVLCCIDWQIHKNEALSCFQTDPTKAIEAASKTTVSRQWFKKNKHRPINFNMPWCEYFKCMNQEDIIPLEYTKYYKSLSSHVKNSQRKEYSINRQFIKTPVFLNNILEKTA